MSKDNDFFKVTFGLEEMAKVRIAIDELLFSSINNLDDIPHMETLFSFICRLNEVIYCYYKKQLTDKTLETEILSSIDAIEN